MSSKKTLVISNNKKLYSKKEKKIFLNVNSFHDVISSKIFENDFFKDNIVKPSFTKKNYINNSSQIKKTINSVSISLRKSLNNFHNENKSQRYWEILFSNWLRTFASIVGERYFNILEAKNSYRFNKIIISKNRFVNQNNNLVDLEKNSVNDAWNFELYSEIIKELNFQNTKIIYNSKYKQKRSSKHNLKGNIYGNFLNKAAIKFFNILLKKNHSMIYDGSLARSSKLKIHFNLFQIPNLAIKLQINYKSINEKERNKLNFNYRNYSGLERVVRKILPLSLPTSIIENYEELSKSVEKLSFPEKPNLIFTSTEYNDNDMFKLLVAKNISNSKYIVAQHGNNYFSIKDYKFLCPEIKVSDFFISWGSIYKDKKIVKLFNLLNLNFRKQNLRKNKIFIFFKPIPKMKIWPWDNYYETFKNYCSSGELICNLSPSLKKKITIKFKYKNNKLNFLNQFIHNIKKFNLDQNTTKKNSLLNSSKLIIFTYESTTFYEAISLNIPCVCLLTKPMYFYTSKTQKIFKDMIKANIFFLNPKLMAQHINKNENSIDYWWNSKQVLKARNIFKYNFSTSVGENPHKRLSNLLLKLSSK